MKKLFAILLCLTLLLGAAGCSADVPQETDPIQTTGETAATDPTKPGTEIFTEEWKAKMDAVLEQNKYTGIVSLTCNGETIYEWVKGTNELEEPLTVESPMFIASNSKQFCAAAILILRDQEKLSLDDTLTKYFPECTVGKDVTLHHLMSMQSGLPRDPGSNKDIEEHFGQTAEENKAAILEWLTGQTLSFTPGTQFAYSNLNYNLLSYVVEQVSGQSYTEFVRENVFAPAGMTHSGFIGDVKDNPQWGVTCDGLDLYGAIEGMAQGCGDIVTTSGDIHLWMTALRSGKVVSMESYREMTTGHSASYGYGLMRASHGGWGHNGSIPGYTSRTYFNEEYGYQLFVVNNKTPLFNSTITDKIGDALLRTLFEAVDAAQN